MRTIQTRNIKSSIDDTGINLLLAEARLDERRGRADVMAARLENLATHITSNKLNSIEAAELLRSFAENIQSEAQEIH